jgi:hypothetical protein
VPRRAEFPRHQPLNQSPGRRRRARTGPARVRLSWANPAMTALAATLTLALGATGAFHTLFALWLLLKKRWPRREQSAA